MPIDENVDPEGHRRPSLTTEGVGEAKVLPSQRFFVKIRVRAKPAS
ncbi:MAG TPA: hypothetical protein VK438_03415 [Xanthobacteraceae bacterium]|nr:hypothetical protein [Xanthobacteraceae bacterium]